MNDREELFKTMFVQSGFFIILFTALVFAMFLARAMV